MHIFIRIFGNNELFFILWILSDGIEGDANIVNFVYCEKTGKTPLDETQCWMFSV